MIDIFFPDYDEERECVFYEVEEEVEPHLYRLSPAPLREVHVFDL